MNKSLETDVQTVTLVQEPITAEWTWTRDDRNTFIFLNLVSLGSIVEPVVRLWVWCRRVHWTKVYSNILCDVLVPS